MFLTLSSTWGFKVREVDFPARKFTRSSFRSHLCPGAIGAGRFSQVGNDSVRQGLTSQVTPFRVRRALANRPCRIRRQ